MRPIVEFMFADFMPSAADAIVNQLPRYRFMSGGQLSMPVRLRIVSIDLRSISPLDLATARESVEKTGRLVVAEERWHDAGWGATLVSRLAMSGTLMASLPRTAALLDDVHIPFASPLEEAVMPSVERIADEVRASLYS